MAPSVFAIFRAQLERILALFRQRVTKDPGRETTGSDSRRAPEAWCSRTGTLHAQIPTRFLTLLSDTPQTKWCYSGSPHPIFHRGPLRRFPWTTCHILARSSTRWPKRPGFSKTIEQWGSSCHRLVQAHVDASVEACATLTPLLETGRSKTPYYLAPTPNPSRIQPYKNHLLSSDNKLLAESSPLDPVWGIGFRADGPGATNPCPGRGNTCSVRHFLPFAKLFATMRPRRRTRPSLVGSVPALRMKNQEISSTPRSGR